MGYEVQTSNAGPISELDTYEDAVRYAGKVLDDILSDPDDNEEQVAICLNCNLLDVGDISQNDVIDFKELSKPTAEWSRIQEKLKGIDDLVEEVKLYKLNTPHTKDGKPIFIGLKIWMEDPDINSFDPERFIEQEVCSIYGRTYDEYEGDYTVSCTDLECGNLETFSTREAIEAAMSGK